MDAYILNPDSNQKIVCLRASSATLTELDDLVKKEFPGIVRDRIKVHAGLKRTGEIYIWISRVES